MLVQGEPKACAAAAKYGQAWYSAQPWQAPFCVPTMASSVEPAGSESELSGSTSPVGVTLSSLEPSTPTPAVQSQPVGARTSMIPASSAYTLSWLARSFGTETLSVLGSDLVAGAGPP